MSSVPLPARARLLQVSLIRRAVEATHAVHYDALSNMAQYLRDLSIEAEELAKEAK